MTSGDGDHRCCVLDIGYSAAERVVLPPSPALTAWRHDGRGWGPGWFCHAGAGWWRWPY